MATNELLERLQAGETMVFGHRGARAYAPMNTIEAFEVAAKMGAAGIELDVHRSADGHAVIVHDFTVDSTTDGSGRVSKMMLAELKALDAGSWFDERFVGVKIPTLDEVFECFGDRMYINVEIKSRSFRTDGVERLVAEKISQYRMESRVIVSSFDGLALMRFRRERPDVPLGYLLEPGIVSVGFHEMVNKVIRAEAFHPKETMINDRLLEQLRRRGRVVNTWDVNDPTRARTLRDLGIGIIITDVPDVICSALAE